MASQPETTPSLYELLPESTLPDTDSLEKGGNYRLHNYFELDKFYSRDRLNQLVDKYRQRAMFVTEDFIVGFQSALEDEVGDAAGEIMYRCGLEWGKQDIVNFEKRAEEEFGRPMRKMQPGTALECWWWPLQAAGWGAWNYDLSHKKEGMIFIDIWDSAVAGSIGNVGHVVCHFYAGMLAAVFGHIANRELSGIEIQCLSMGENYCKFLIASSKRINAAQFWVSEGASATEVMDRL